VEKISHTVLHSIVFELLKIKKLKKYNINKFNVHGSVRHRNNIPVYKSQQDAHVTEFIFV